MSANSADSFPTPVKPPLRLIVRYLAPSRANISGHWSKKYKEQSRALGALSFALRDALGDPSTATIYGTLLKTCSTALDMHILSRGIPKKKLSLPSAKLNLYPAKKNLP